jgi:2-oxoglutarate ferredoxin oxidoreductase subunit gamma
MNIVCAGFGGQGVLTAGLILGKTGVDIGKNVTWIPSYGSEMRGGTANCNLKISDRKISSPFVKDIDVLLVMNVPSAEKFESKVKPGGLIISNKTMISGRTFRDDVMVVEVEATSIADELGNPKGSNIVMLGALAASGQLFDEKTIGEGIENFFRTKGKDNPRNALCFQKGVSEANIKQG